MSTKRSYSIEQDGENFVLIETSDAYGKPVVRVPYSIQQEADSGVSAVAKNPTHLRADRQEIALHLARKASSLISLIPTAENLLEIRKITEALITASIAEIRKTNTAPESSGGRPRRHETIEQLKERHLPTELPAQENHS